jgi:hypothetical protein
MNTLRTLSSGLMIAFFSFGCIKVMDSEKSAKDQTMMPDPNSNTMMPENGNLNPGQMAAIDPTKPVAKAGQRSRRRLDLDQLQASLKQVTGMAWTVERDGQDFNRFDELSETLGKPDFDGITHEELAPTTMFQRFLDEAALSNCNKLMENEQKSSQSDRMFFVHADWNDDWASSPSRISANLQSLLLRYHGRDYAVDASGFKGWLALYQQAESVADTSLTAWNTVCVGLVTHPDFYTF